MLLSRRRLLEALKLTQSAIARLKQLSKSKGEEVYLRISVEAGGCSGFKYNINVAEWKSKRSDDAAIIQDGCTVLIDSASSEFLVDAELDYRSDMVKSSFEVVANKAAVDRCGCGASFDVNF